MNAEGPLNIKRRAIYSDDKGYLNLQENLRFNMQKVAELAKNIEEIKEDLVEMSDQITTVYRMATPDSGSASAVMPLETDDDTE